MHPMKLGSDPVIVKLKPEDLAGTLKSLAAEKFKLTTIPENQLSLFASISSTEYDKAGRIEIDEKISEIVKKGGITKENPLFLVVPDGERIS